MKKKLLLLLSLWLILGVSAYAGKRIVVDLSTQTATAYENGSQVFSGNISTGTAKRPTPTGSYRVLEKDIDHVSTSWPKPHGGAKMHYMLRLTNYGIAMHLGFVPNYPASHGCIRLQNGFAQRMYHWAHVGVPVRVVGHPPARVYRSIARRGTHKKKKTKKRLTLLDTLSSPVRKNTTTDSRHSKKLTALEVFNASPKTERASAPKRGIATKVKKRYVKVKRKRTNSVSYRAPSTLDLLSGSPKAAKRVEAAQKEKWQRRPKRKAPRVDPLRAMRA